jgi:hypothetical protein
MGQRALKFRVLVADVMDEFILRAYVASVDVGRRVIRLGQEEVPVREAPTASLLTRSRPTEGHRNRRPVCWQCSGAGYFRKRCSRRTARNVADKHDWRERQRQEADGRVDSTV